jgi:hypothetical protein
MHYELLLQPNTVGEAFPFEAVIASLTARGAQNSGSDGWALPTRAGLLHVRSLLEQQAMVALEVQIELTENPILLREAATLLLDIAKETSTRVIDPQLARAIALSDLGEMETRYLESSAYAGNFPGYSQTVGMAPPPRTSTGINSQTLFWAVVTFAFAAGMAYFLLS